MNILICSGNKGYADILLKSIRGYNDLFKVNYSESIDCIDDCYHVIFMDADYALNNVLRYKGLVVYICNQDVPLNELLDINVIGCIHSIRDIEYMDRWMKIVQEYYGMNSKMVDIGRYSLDLNKIWAVESSGNYVIIYVDNDVYRVRCSLKEVWNILKEYVCFARINRYYIVNLRVVEIDGNKAVTLGDHCTISPHYIEDVLKRKMEV